LGPVEALNCPGPIFRGSFLGNTAAAIVDAPINANPRIGEYWGKDFAMKFCLAGWNKSWLKMV
jgi:hypothetical protein